MSTRPLIFSEEEYYHIYSRGTDGRDIFLDNSDRERFIKLLFVANGTKPFVFRDFKKGLNYLDFDKGREITAIGSYCLMKNHFHLLLKETHDSGITRFMGKVLTSYSSYFNKKYSRKGRLFETTFQAKHLNNDKYLKYIFSYIHLNPVKIIDSKWRESGIKNKNKAKKFLNSYLYSSYCDYIGLNRKECAILNKEAFPNYFTNPRNFKDFIEEWLTFNGDNLT